MIYDWINNQLIPWIIINSSWYLFVVFIISFLESFAIVGLLVPGSVILSAIGVLIGADKLPLYSTLIFASLGAFVGDLVSFLLGYIYNDKIKIMWPFNIYPQIYSKGTFFIQKHGRKSIFLARFIGPIRPVVPLVAGILKMPLQRFLIVDLIAAFIWAPLYIFSGIIIAYLSSYIFNNNVESLAITLIIVLILAWGIFFITMRRFDAQVKRYIRSIKIHFKMALNEHNNMLLFIWSIISLAIFVALLSYIVINGQKNVLNTLFEREILSLFKPIPVILIKYITLLGDKFVIVPFFFAIFSFFIFQKKYILSLLWFMNGFFLGSMTWIIKRFIKIYRPELTNNNELFSYPSAHVVLFTGIIGYLIYIIRPKRKILTWGLFIMTSCILSLSRIYLEFHWVTDILGSLCLISIIAPIMISCTSPHVFFKKIEKNKSIVLISAIYMFLFFLQVFIIKL